MRQYISSANGSGSTAAEKGLFAISCDNFGLIRRLVFSNLILFDPPNLYVLFRFPTFTLQLFLRTCEVLIH